MNLSPLLVGKAYQEIASFDKGLRMLLDFDDFIQRQIYYFGYYFIEREETKVFHTLLRPGDVFMDIGAHVGVYTLQAAVRVGPLGHVHAFEPIYANFNRLKENVLMNQLKNVTLNRLAVSDASGSLRLFVSNSSDSGTSSISKNTINANTSESWSGLVEEVEAVTIDEYVIRSFTRCVNLVKIDVEGCELKVLRGMRHLLSNDNPPQLLIEIASKHLEAAGTSSSELLAFLKELKYEPFLITRSGLKAASFLPDTHLVLFRHRSNR